MSYSDIQHRFANKQAGKNGRISSGNVRYEGRNYFSYSTVFGQWLDIEKNVVAIFDGSTSTSSSKHRLYKGLFPDDVHVFPLDLGGGYYGWRNCNLVSSYNFKDEDFKEYHRMQMLDYYVERIYNHIAAINGGKSKGLEKVSFEAWGYIEELCSLYKDTSIEKWIKWSCRDKHDENGKLKQKLARMLKDGERNVQVLTDALFGEGTFKTYWDYCARFRKASDKRAKVDALCERLGICSPYESSWRGGRMDTGLTAEQIRRLTAKERLELHFKALARKEYNAHESERKEKYNKNFRNAYKWIVGCEPKKKYWGGYEKEVHNNCVNKDTGKEYTISGHINFRVYDMRQTIDFMYDEYRNSEDKEQWISDFYAKCDEIDRNVRALAILDRFGDAVYTDQPIDYSTCRVYVDNDVLREGTTKEEHELCVDFITRWNAILADKEVRARAEAIERARVEAERKAEEEYRAQVKQEQIDECIANGVDGCRNLWRLHLTPIWNAKDEAVGVSENDFYYHGNVLLRLNLKKDRVETSKNIRMPIEVAKKFFLLIKRWHDGVSVFKPIEIDTKGSGKYTISSYEDDILTAGCHKIAYKEMERMYNELLTI